MTSTEATNHLTIMYMYMYYVIVILVEHDLTERTISDDERMLDILNEWGAHKDEVKFFLNCESGELSPYNNNNISKPDLNITNMSGRYHYNIHVCDGIDYLFAIFVVFQ